MTKEDFALLRESLEQAVAFKRGKRRRRDRSLKAPRKMQITDRSWY